MKNCIVDVIFIKIGVGAQNSQAPKNVYALGAQRFAWGKKGITDATYRHRQGRFS